MSQQRDQGRGRIGAQLANNARFSQGLVSLKVQDGKLDAFSLHYIC